MKANKRVRDLDRRSTRRLSVDTTEMPGVGVTTMPTRDNGVKVSRRESTHKRFAVRGGHLNRSSEVISRLTPGDAASFMRVK